MVFAFSNVHPHAQSEIGVHSAKHYPGVKIQDGHVVQIQGRHVRAFEVPGRPWQLQVINSTHMGFLQTFTDTALDHLTQTSRYCFMHVHGHLKCFHIPATHDAYFNTASNTIFYLTIRIRQAQAACPPFYKAGDTLMLESVVETSSAGETLWELPVETVLCHKPLVHPGYSDAEGGITAPFHLNTVLYMHHEDTILVTSRFQGTAYKLQRNIGSQRQKGAGSNPATLLWAVGWHWTIPTYSITGHLFESPFYDIHHFRPIGNGKYAVFVNSKERPKPVKPNLSIANIPFAQNSYVTILEVDEKQNHARIVFELKGRHRYTGGGLITGTDGMVGGMFGNCFPYPGEPPELIVKSAMSIARCNFTHHYKSAFLYGGAFLYDNFGLAFNGSHISGHNRHWDVEPQMAELSICMTCRLDRLHQVSPTLDLGANVTKDGYFQVQVLLPSFLMRFFYRLPSNHRNHHTFSVCVAVLSHRWCMPFSSLTPPPPKIRWVQTNPPKIRRTYRQISGPIDARK
mmetsp:Transcript_151068/g.263978  ORF Transcript_151068/g.263978 Transcript_151068/m.263978 type:complete len:513 (-) Transcript_151068:126-1664(-)